MISYRLKSLLNKLIAFIQIPTLYIADKLLGFYFSVRPHELKKHHRKYVIGVDEIAKNIYYLKETLGNAYSVVLQTNRFYDLKYDFTFGRSKILRTLFSPVLLAYLSYVSDIFIYIWQTGFIADREHDFRFLKNKGRKIVAIFAGDDIRSIKKCKEYYASLDMDCHCNYYSFIDNYYDSEDYESEKMQVARIAENYCNAIIGSHYGQFPYGLQNMHPFIYMVDIEEFNVNMNKFNDMNSIKIVHAPSSPIIKGTPLVRAAIKKLKLEGYRFEYIELINMSNSRVRALLAESHIVLNQFYALNPGLFGIEAMAAGTAVLMSPDPETNSELPSGARDAWVITPYWQIYEKLKVLLDKPETIKDFASRGRALVEKNYTFEKAREKFLDIFEKSQILQ